MKANFNNFLKVLLLDLLSNIIVKVTVIKLNNNLTLTILIL